MSSTRQRYDRRRLWKQIQLSQCRREGGHIVKVNGETGRGWRAESHPVEIGIQLCGEEGQLRDCFLGKRL